MTCAWRKTMRRASETRPSWLTQGPGTRCGVRLYISRSPRLGSLGHLTIPPSLKGLFALWTGAGLHGVCPVGLRSDVSACGHGCRYGGTLSAGTGMMPLGLLHSLHLNKALPSAWRSVSGESAFLQWGQACADVWSSQSPTIGGTAE